MEESFDNFEQLWEVPEEEVDLDSRIPDDCITDPELQFEYLGSAFYLNVLHNT